MKSLSDNFKAVLTRVLQPGKIGEHKIELLPDGDRIVIADQWFIAKRSTDKFKNY